MQVFRARYDRDHIFKAISSTHMHAIGTGSHLVGFPAGTAGRRCGAIRQLTEHCCTGAGGRYTRSVVDIGRLAIRSITANEIHVRDGELKNYFLVNILCLKCRKFHPTTYDSFSNLGLYQSSLDLTVTRQRERKKKAQHKTLFPERKY